ncbi:MAG: type II secretion system F family protein [Candidatus Eremiobacteraeota bacterium]|nr:type II secretion system F family protein [Candidatus Eremiobacteraeota bacterium]
MLPLIAISGAIAAFLLAVSLLPQRAPIRRTLDLLERRPSQRRDPGKIKAFEKLFSKENRSRLSGKLMEAGWYTVTPAKMGVRIVGGAIAGCVATFALLQFLHVNFTLTLVVTLVLTGIAAYTPMSILQRACEARKVQVQKTLPDFLDMVATTVQAGLSVNAALAYAIDSAPGALGDEIRVALSEIRLGRARSEALRGAAMRLRQQQFTTTITAITQAERLGTNISRVLSELAEDVRNARIMIVEEKAAKLPVKMVLPMAFFMLPSIFTVIFGALVANYMSQQK